jgi:hypothetical protein
MPIDIPFHCGSALGQQAATDLHIRAMPAEKSLTIKPLDNMRT